MIKKIIYIKILSLLIFFPLITFAALRWDVAAFIATGTAVAVSALSVAAAAPIIISGVLAVGFQ